MGALILPSRLNQQPQQAVQANGRFTGMGLFWLTLIGPAARGSFLGNSGAAGYLSNVVDGALVNSADSFNQFYLATTRQGIAGVNSAGTNAAALLYSASTASASAFSGLTEFSLFAWFVFNPADTSAQWLNFRNDNNITLDVFSQTSSSVTWGCDWAGAWNGTSTQTLSGLAAGDLVCLGVSVNSSGARFFSNKGFSGTKSGSSFTTSVSTLKVASATRSALLGQAAFNRALPDSVMQEIAGNPWQLAKAPPRRLWVPSSGSNVSVALNGQAATSSAGSIIPSIDRPLVGASATASAGSVSAGGDVSVSLAGQAASASAGALTAGSAIGLSGSSGSSAAGSLTPSGSVALMGQAAAGAQGSVGVVGDVTVALTGLAMVMALGQLSVSQATGAGRLRRKFQVETSRGIIEVDTLDEVAEVARAEKRVPKAKNVEVKLAGIKVPTPSLKPNLDYRAIEDRMRAQVQAEIDDEEGLLLMML